MKKIIILILILLMPIAAFAERQHDYQIELSPEKFKRKMEYNPVLEAIVTNNGGATDPGVNKIYSADFSGAGINDATSGGTFSGTDDELYQIVIDATGVPDSFKWRKLCRDNVACPFLEGINITGAAQTLSEGVTVTFGATSGHTFNDEWTIFAHKGKTYPLMTWADTANDLMKIRNQVDTAWISLYTLSTGVPASGGGGTECATAACALNAATTAVDEVYSATNWNGNNEIPTKNAIRDKIETLPGGHDPVTLAGTGTYISLASQIITVDPITESDISDLSHTPDEVGTVNDGDLCLGSTSVVACTVNLESELETALDGINVIVATEIDTSAEIAGIVGDETGTGALVFGTAPTFTTSITIGLAGITEPELEILDGATPTTTEFNLLSGLTVLSGSNTGDDDVPEAGDFGAATDLDSNGALNAASVDFPEIKFDNTLAGSPALAVDECFFFSDLSGGGLLCEGSTADTSEQLYRLPDANGADTTEYFVIADDANVSAAEAGFLDGVTSAIQTQIDSKEGTLTNEAGLYAALSDVTDFLQTGDVLAGDDITDGSIDASEIAADAINLAELDDGADTPIAGEVLFVATGATDVEYKFITESFCVAISDEETAITTGTAKVTMRMPYAFTLTDIRGSLNTVSSSGSPIFDVNDGGTSIMTTNKILIDVSEKTSETAVTAPTLTDTALADDAEITFDIDTPGTGAKGAKICLIGHQ